MKLTILTFSIGALFSISLYLNWNDLSIDFLNLAQNWLYAQKYELRIVESGYLLIKEFYMFLDVFNELCLRRGEAPNTVAKKLHIASGTVSEWKKGRTPKNSTLKKLADYFGVSVEYMLGNESFTSEQTALDENTVMYRYNGEKFVKRLTKGQMEALHLVIDALPESK